MKILAKRLNIALPLLALLASAVHLANAFPKLGTSGPAVAPSPTTASVGVYDEPNDEIPPKTPLAAPTITLQEIAPTMSPVPDPENVATILVDGKPWCFTMSVHGAEHRVVWLEQAGAQWQAEPLVGGNEPLTCMSVDATIAKGVPYVAVGLAAGPQHGSRYGNSIRVCAYRGGKWNLEYTEPTPSDHIGDHIAIAAADGQPFVVATDASSEKYNFSPNVALFERGEDGHWTRSKLNASAQNVVHLSAACIGGQKAVLIEGQLTGTLYGEHGAGGWVFDKVIPNRQSGARLLEWNANPAFLFTERVGYGAEETTTTSLMYRAEGKWNKQEVHKRGHVIGKDACIINGKPWALYYDGIENKLHYRQLVPAGWTDLPVVIQPVGKWELLHVQEVEGRPALFAYTHDKPFAPLRYSPGPDVGAVAASRSGGVPDPHPVVRSYGTWAGGSVLTVANGGPPSNTYLAVLREKWTHVTGWSLKQPAERFPGAWAREVISTSEDATSAPQPIHAVTWGNRPAVFAFACTRASVDSPVMEIRRRGIWNRELLGGNRPDGSANAMDACLINGVPYVAFASGEGSRHSGKEHFGLTVRSLRADGWHLEFESSDDPGNVVAIGSVHGRPAVATSGGKAIRWFECGEDGKWLLPEPLPGSSAGSLSIREVSGRPALLGISSEKRDVLYFERDQSVWNRKEVGLKLKGNCRLLEWQGNPAFAIGGIAEGGKGRLLWVTRKNDVWSYEELADSQDSLLYCCDAAIIKGIPTVVFSGTHGTAAGKVHYRTLTGKTWSDSVIDDTADSWPMTYSLIELKGHAALFAREHGTGLPGHIVYMEAASASK